MGQFGWEYTRRNYLKYVFSSWKSVVGKCLFQTWRTGLGGPACMAASSVKFSQVITQPCTQAVLYSLSSCSPASSLATGPGQSSHTFNDIIKGTWLSWNFFMHNNGKFRVLYSLSNAQFLKSRMSRSFPIFYGNPEPRQSSLWLITQHWFKHSPVCRCSIFRLPSIPKMI